MGPKAAPRSNQSTTAGAPKPPAVGTVKPPAVGTVKAPPAGTVKAPTAGTVKAPTTGTVRAPAAGGLGPQKTAHSTTPGPGQAHTKSVNGVASRRTGDSSDKRCCHVSVGRRTARPSRKQATLHTAGSSHASGNKSQHTSVPSGADNPSGNRVPSNAGSSSHATGSSSSRVPSSSTGPGKPVCDTRTRQEERRGGIPKLGSSDSSLVKIEVFISRGHQRDCYFDRHVRAHFTSPQVPSMQETVHAAYIRLGGVEQWEVIRDHDKTELQLRESFFFQSKMDPVWITVNKGQEMLPPNIFANVSVTGREPEWNCQSFLLEGFEKLAERGYKTMQWYGKFEDELIDEVMLGSQTQA